MILLRVYLLLGMALHKLVWEVLKRKGPGSETIQKADELGMMKKILKLGKMMVLIFLVVQTFLPILFPISAQPAALQIAGVILYSIGLATAIIGRTQLGQNWVDLEDYRILPEQRLVQTGIYHYIRHPIYIGDTLLVLGLELALNSWLVLGVLVLIPIIVKQALEEEAILDQAFPDYHQYRERTKMFIPYVI